MQMLLVCRYVAAKLHFLKSFASLRTLRTLRVFRASKMGNGSWAPG